MHPKLNELVRLLDLERIEQNLFRAYHPEGRTRRLFGGQIMAQALVAAARTVDETRLPHSLHGYFLRPGDPRVPALIEVERIRDGKSFATRRVVVVQNGEAIFNLDASFQVEEEGLSHAAEMPDRAPPDLEDVPEYLLDSAFVTWRHDHRRLLSESPQPPFQDVWFRANGKLDDDPVLHAALLVYESDNALLSTGRLPHRGSFKRENMQVASLDHAMWFHRQGRADEWCLYALDSPAASAGRGLNRGMIFSESGSLLASTIQEGLIRLRD